jgi:FkbM family methyltransferase
MNSNPTHPACNEISRLNNDFRRVVQQLFSNGVDQSQTNSLFEAFEKFELILSVMQGKGFLSGGTQKEIVQAHSLLTKAPRLAIDIGGSIGDYTAELRERNTELEIHTFEPAAKNIPILRSRFASDANINIVPFAVSDSSGTGSLFANESGSELGSLTKRQLDHYGIKFDFEETISVLRFEDYWVDTLQSRDIDIVKIDVEGHELSVLKGFGKAIFSTKLVQFEMGGTDIDTRVFFRDFWHFFMERDFEIYRMTPIGVKRIAKYGENEECFSYMNYFALNRRGHERHTDDVSR